jgi:hypothetical protein
MSDTTFASGSIVSTDTVLTDQSLSFPDDSASDLTSSDPLSDDQTLTAPDDVSDASGQIGWEAPLMSAGWAPSANLLAPTISTTGLFSAPASGFGKTIWHLATA